MNMTQWVFEYRGLRQREEQEVKTQMMMKVEQTKLLKAHLISLLGLNFDPEAFKLDPIPFTPMSALVGRPGMLKSMLDKQHEEAAINEGLQDEKFDKFSRDLQQQVETGHSDLPADMVPLIMDPVLTPHERWTSDEMQAALAAMGVRITDPEPDPEDL